MINALEDECSLVIVRTPFQAWLAQKVIKEEGVETYDIVYLTHNNSEEDIFYYGLLKLRARCSDYIYVKPKRWDILSHLAVRWKARKWYVNRGYEKVIFASINSNFVNATANSQINSNFVTFDDGVANIFKGGTYYEEPSSRRILAYKKLLGAVSLKILTNRIVRHYSVFDGYDNIVEKKRLTIIPGWERKFSSSLIASPKEKKYFIGAPFHEVMTPSQIRKLEKYAKSESIDVYVKHPRENFPLDIGAPMLDKKCRIAEEAILADAGESQIILYGFLSTVLVNLAGISKNQVAVIPEDTAEYSKLFDLAIKAGCEVKTIS